MIKSNLNQRYTAGFTLIEMAVVMIISGILLAFLGSALTSYLKKSSIQKTEYRMEEIKEALSQYLSVNKRYPCPAPNNIAPAAAGFGREVATDCRGVHAGTARTNILSRPNPPGPPVTGRVKIGSVPTRSLNLPDDFMMDGWGRRFTYAVTDNLATNTGATTTYTNDGGLIEVADSSGTPFINDAHYVVVSHGATKEGGRTLDGVASSCTSGARDNQNCNNDARFLTTLVNSEAAGANFYDDYLYYQGQTVPDLIFPAGAVMPFNLAACPDGWSNYALAAGKFVIGVGTNVPVTSYTYTTLTPTATTPIDISTAGLEDDKNDSTMMPPYVALLYCEKD